jgi:DNA-binding MurR/RpiR family transcriptional regulator
MENNLLALIAENHAAFSKGQKKIAQFITEHYDEAAFMTALRLGQAVGVSESTVVRFAAELGFDGYPRLQKAMQGLIRSRLTTLQRIEVSRARLRDDEVLDDVMSYDVANIRQTLEEMPRDVFYSAVDAIVQARRVYIFGAGSCKSLASFAAYYLKMFLPNVQLITVSGQSEIFEEMINISEEDAIIGISFPRYSSRAVRTLHYAASKSAKVIAVTDTAASPIAKFASHLLLAHSDMASVVDSLTAPLSLLNALIVAVSLKQLEERREVLSELETLWNNYEVYLSLDGRDGK